MRPPMIARPTTPPTTPPAIAPVLDFLELEDPPDPPEPSGVPDEEVEGLLVLGDPEPEEEELGTVAVGMGTNVDSGESPAFWASMAFHVPLVVTLRYAH